MAQTRAPRRRASWASRMEWMLVAAALMPHRITRSLSSISAGSMAGVSPMTAFQPASLAGEQMVRSSRDAPSLWKKGCPVLRCTSPMVPA